MRGWWSYRWIALACVWACCSVLVAPTASWAQRKPVPASPLKEGETAAKAGRWDDALPKFEEAYQAQHSLAALEGIARSHDALGHDAIALSVYEQLLEAAVESKQKDAPQVARRAKVARDAIAKRVGKLTVTVAAEGAEVKLDGELFGTGPVTRTVVVKTGKHKLTAQLPKAKIEEKEIDVAAAATTTVELIPPPPPKDEPAAPVEAEPRVEAEGPDPWAVPHGSVRYAPIRTDVEPKIDGNLDDAVWQKAPIDAHFYSARSKPYGMPTREPTSVQAAYDERNLYVAFRCGYSSKRPRDDAYPSDDINLLALAESVAVAIDPLHDHQNMLLFAVSRSGAKADIEFSGSGAEPNFGWRGIWSAAVQRGPDAWTVEYKIPWGTMRMPAHDAPFEIGIQFRRREPNVGELALWALHPPATLLYDTNYFGHLSGLQQVHPDRRLLIWPYMSMAVDAPAQKLSPLFDFATTQSNFRIYGGAYARYYPPGPFRFEATFNPDFSIVSPDNAVANFDRFELLYPEQRPFFAEDNARFQFGSAGAAQGEVPGENAALLFYSRRLGLSTDPLSGITTPAPIMYGAKSIVRQSGFETGAMAVGIAPATAPCTPPNPADPTATCAPKVGLDQNVGVVRSTYTFGEGRRVGLIGLGRAGSGVNAYGALGADGTFTLFDRHLSVGGFYAQSFDQVPGANIGVSGAGEARLRWDSQDFYAYTVYQDIGTGFTAPLGYVPLPGTRSNAFVGGYTPVVRNDLVQRVYLEGSFNTTRDRDDQRIFDRGTVSLSGELQNEAVISASVSPALEQVYDPFPIGGSGIIVGPGRYPVLTANMFVQTAPRGLLVGTLGYTTGDLFDGKRDVPHVDIGLNWGRFVGNVGYQIFFLRYPGRELFVGHGISSRIAFSYSPQARTSLIVQMNTLQQRDVIQLSNTFTFGNLSTIALVLSQNSGPVPVPAEQWFSNGTYSAILYFILGLSPF